mmetsp:Transcript_16071/g.41342  ORF Transcript_16071/g.41342 Transcript_16071/m.41342 type:complete len:83 (+) Transcript_16071:567-815(+)
MHELGALLPRLIFSRSPIDSIDAIIGASPRADAQSLGIVLFADVGNFSNSLLKNGSGSSCISLACARLRMSATSAPSAANAM